MIAATKNICDQVIENEASIAKSGLGTIQARHFGEQGLRLVFPYIDRWIQMYGDGIIPAYKRAFGDAFELICHKRIYGGKVFLDWAKANPPKTHRQLTHQGPDFDFYKNFFTMQTETEFWTEQLKWFGDGLPVHVYNPQGTIDIVLSKENE